MPRMAAAVIILSLFAFWPIHRNGFVSLDDGEYITQNPVVQRGISIQGIVLAFTRSYAANWHPLTWVSHMLDVDLFGLDPRGHHFVGFAFHLATALILLATLRAMTGLPGPSFLVAALFAVHPLHVESVVWAAERKDVLSAFFWTSTMAAYLRYAQRPGIGRFVPVLLLFALGLMAKPMVVTLPLVLLLLDWWPLGRRGRIMAASGSGRSFSRGALLLEKVPLFALSTLTGLLAIKAQAAGSALLPLEVFPLAERVANAVTSLVRYLGKTFWPSGLAVFYPFAGRSLAEPRVLAAGLFLAGVTFAALRLRRRCPWFLSGWLWYLVTLLPVLGLVQVGEQAMADRYTYLPLVGIFLACAWGWASVPRRRGVFGAGLAMATAIPLLLLAGLTRRQTAVWHDDETLFGHAVLVTKGNWKATYSLGLAREAAGDREGAARLHREAIRLKPDFSKARFAYALDLDKKGRTGEAIEELRSAVRALPSDPVIRMTLALLLIREGLEEEAITTLRDLIARRPNYTEAYNNLAVLLTRRGREDEAVLLLRRALAIDPLYTDARMNLEALTGARSEAPLNRR